MKVKADYKKELQFYAEKSENMNDLGVEEGEAVLRLLKNVKAASEDGILPEFLKHMGIKGKFWLERLFSSVKNNNTLPKQLREAKVIAILKPGKPGDPKSYRPISLLSVVYKLFETVLLVRIQTKIEEHLPAEQVGFRQGRSSSGQVLSLTMFIENGFQKKLKTGTVFLDLSCAHHTVWKRGLLLKLAKILRCKTSLRLIDNILSDRKFREHLNGKGSKYKFLQNGLLQGSVLSPILFNAYTADITNIS